MKVISCLLLTLLLSAPLSAQETIEVRSLPDAASWATAAINPAVGVYQAIRSNDPTCHLSQMAISGSVASLGFLTQKWIKSDRPCIGSPGCSPGSGMWSTHSALAQVGAWQWKVQYSIPLGTVTPSMRVAAHQHTPLQAVVGFLAGQGGEALSHWLVKCPS